MSVYSNRPEEPVVETRKKFPALRLLLVALAVLVLMRMFGCSLLAAELGEQSQIRTCGQANNPCPPLTPPAAQANVPAECKPLQTEPARQMCAARVAIEETNAQAALLAQATQAVENPCEPGQKEVVEPTASWTGYDLDFPVDARRTDLPLPCGGQYTGVKMSRAAAKHERDMAKIAADVAKRQSDNARKMARDAAEAANPCMRTFLGMRYNCPPSTYGGFGGGGGFILQSPVVLGGGTSFFVPGSGNRADVGTGRNHVYVSGTTGPAMVPPPANTGTDVVYRGGGR